VRAYRRELAVSAERMSQVGESSDAFELQVDRGSPLAGNSVRQAGLPSGLLITSIHRGTTVLVPTGDTLLEVGDRLALLSWSSAAAPDDLG
jgi:Trk K+ transport system NAD-binding subunit